ncbi:iron complex transport system substrate-binding protein [Roseivivax halotolerans]|uniref:Iron complex transport system substrate-binding protein n=1 Tax=Roseivivax halotolerans TaxID=93684 RepID=A0A1I6A624_9RHOB|nr:iron-siderophore ABC transporter substrate-binding protein [Roseivivax halotolerans]SFQ64159.1 iron complex transport system substrate-binding protein [Roseivivax halotolerans]
MKRLLATVAALAALALPAVAQEMRTYTDALGREVEIPVDPQRVVVLNDSNGGAQTLELGITPVGMTTRSGVFELGSRYDLSGTTPIGDYGAPDLEAIAALNPDLIVGYTASGEAGQSPGEISAFEALAPFVMPETFAPVHEVMADFAALYGREEMLAELRSRDAERLAEVRALLDVDFDDLSVSVVQINSEGLVNTFRAGFFAFGEVLTELGFRNFPENQTDSFAEGECCTPDVSMERIQDFDADVLFYVHYTPDTDPMNDPLFRSLNAVQAGQAFEWDDDWWGNTYGTRMNVLDDLAAWFTETPIRADVHP